jgi:RHS repeat-associated protein
VNIGILNNPKLYNYHYDQLNRLTGMDVLNGTNTGLNLWTNNLTPSNDYTEKASYDPNGNILTYIRHGYGATPAMDSMTYHYQAGTNKLNHIGDNSAYTSNYPNDLDDQDADNYTYDEAGNLIQDKAAGITSDMTWSVYGKLLTIPSKSISYQYDAAGNRIGKTVGSTSTWYVRDAQGNILATYSGSTMALEEQDLYGSSRLGTISNPTALSLTSQYLDHLGSGTLFTFTRGKKLFELTNHLGNVLATVSDKKFGTPVTGIPSQISYYTTDVKSAQDYYPFGMEMPGRQFNANYVYSFNGKRDDKDAEYGWQDYGMREYDRRRGQFISVDPLSSKYPMLTPFQFASNNSTSGIDLDGLEYLNVNDSKIRFYIKYDPLLRKVSAVNVFFNMENITPATREALRVRPVEHCLNCIVPVGGNMMVGQLIFKNPIIKSASEGSMEDVPTQPNSLTQNEINTLKIPKNKSDLRAMEKTKSFTNSSNTVSSGTTKGDQILAFIQAETWMLQQSITNNVEDDVNTATKQGRLYSKNVFVDLKIALDNNILPSSYINNSDLTAFANYLLNGETPKKAYTLKNAQGEEYFPVDQRKLHDFQIFDASLQKKKADLNNKRTETKSVLIK